MRNIINISLPEAMAREVLAGEKELAHGKGKVPRSLKDDIYN